MTGNFRENNFMTIELIKSLSDFFTALKDRASNEPQTEAEFILKIKPICEHILEALKKEEVPDK